MKGARPEMREEDGSDRGGLIPRCRAAKEGQKDTGNVSIRRGSEEKEEKRRTEKTRGRIK